VKRYNFAAGRKPKNRKLWVPHQNSKENTKSLRDRVGRELEKAKSWKRETEKSEERRRGVRKEKRKRTRKKINEEERRRVTKVEELKRGKELPLIRNG
jgi:hypothetical protein